MPDPVVILVNGLYIEFEEHGERLSSRICPVRTIATNYSKFARHRAEQKAQWMNAPNIVCFGQAITAGIGCDIQVRRKMPGSG